MECYDQVKQRNYWFNSKTGESAWSRPAAANTTGANGALSGAAAQRAESQFATGQRLFKQNRYEEAIDAFTNALEGGHPDKGKVFSFRGVCVCVCVCVCVSLYPLVVAICPYHTEMSS